LSAVVRRLNGDNLNMVTNFHLVFGPYAWTKTMGSPNGKQCPTFPAHEKSFRLPTAAAVKGSGRVMDEMDRSVV
jgi:hypothetical protein